MLKIQVLLGVGGRYTVLLRNVDTNRYAVTFRKTRVLLAFVLVTLKNKPKFSGSRQSQRPSSLGFNAVYSGQNGTGVSDERAASIFVPEPRNESFVSGTKC